MRIELHLVTLCLIVLAVEPAERLVRQARNWLDRRRIHEAHLAHLEENQK
jgi:hypothetical protein